MPHVPIPHLHTGTVMRTGKLACHQPQSVPPSPHAPRCTHPRTGSPPRSRSRRVGADGAEDVAAAGAAADQQRGGAVSPAGAVSAAGARRGFSDEFRTEDRNLKTVYRARRREGEYGSRTAAFETNRARTCCLESWNLYHTRAKLAW